MSKPVILFDFDGTIMDTEPVIIKSYEHLFELYRTKDEFTNDKQVAVLGPAIDVMIHRFFPEVDLEQAIEEYRRFQVANIKTYVDFMPNGKLLLETLKQQGYQLGIVTTRLHSSVQHIMEVFDMEKYFGVVVGQDDVTVGKPDPSGILLALKTLKVDNKNALMVGDSKTDIEAGKNAGIKTVGLLDRKEKIQSILDAKPDIVINDLMELVTYLKEE